MADGTTPDPDRIDGRVALALVAMGLSVFVIANDFSALSVALPEIEKEFDTDVSTVQWVINAYALVFGVLIVTGGRLADLFGRRRIFFIGSAIFAGFSLLGGASQSIEWLIATRAVMGIGGAMMWPAVLGMTFAALPPAKAGLAGGLILGVAGFGNAAGPLLGGFLTDALSWRWILYLNLPIALFACFMTWREIHQPPVETEDDRIDYAGVVTISTGLVALLIALDEAPDSGWGAPLVLGCLAVSIASLTAFAVIERRAGAKALVPRDVMRNAEFRSTCVATLLASATFFAALLYLPQYMQKILGYSPLEAGLGLLPMMATFAATSFVAGSLYGRIGPKVLVSAGAAGIALGALLLSFVERGTGYTAIVPGMFVVGLGVGLFYSAVTTAGVTALDASRASLAGGILYMFQVAGGSIGLGLTTTVFTSASQGRLTDDIASLQLGLTGAETDAVQGVLAGTESAADVIASYPGEVADQVVSLVRDAFLDGLQWAFRLDAVLALGGLVVSVLFVGGSVLASRRQTAADPPA